MCMYVRLNRWIYILDAHIHINIHVCMCNWMNIHVFIYFHGCMQMNTHQCSTYRCIYLNVYKHRWMSMYVHINRWIFILPPHIHMNIHVCMYNWMNIHVCMYFHGCMQMNTHLCSRYRWIYLNLCKQRWMCMYVRINTWIHILDAHIHINIHACMYN
jgi:hypothetical protein